MFKLKSCFDIQSLYIFKNNNRYDYLGWSSIGKDKEIKCR